MIFHLHWKSGKRKSIWGLKWIADYVVLQILNSGQVLVKNMVHMQWNRKERIDCLTVKLLIKYKDDLIISQGRPKT